MDADSALGRGENSLVGRYGETLFDLMTHALWLGGGQIDLVDDRNDLKTGVHGHHRVGDGLRLDALRRIDNEHHALARLERARDLIGEVNVPRCVDEVELIGLAVLRLIEDSHGLRLDGDTALALDIH